MLSVIYAECHYAEYHYSVCHYTECHGALRIRLLARIVSQNFIFVQSFLILKRLLTRHL